MFGTSQGHGTLNGPRPIHHADVPVSIGDAVDVHKTRRDQGACARFGCGRALTKKFDVQSAFLPGFANRGDLRVFVQLDVTAQRKPLVK